MSKTLKVLQKSEYSARMIQTLNNSKNDTDETLEKLDKVVEVDVCPNNFETSVDVKKPKATKSPQQLHLINSNNSSNNTDEREEKQVKVDESDRYRNPRETTIDAEIGELTER